MERRPRVHLRPCVTLPSAADLDAILASARKHGVTHLRMGAFEARFAPPAPQVVSAASLVADINRDAPLPAGDPIEEIRRQLGVTTKLVSPGNGVNGDVLDHLAAGGRLTVSDNPDPTAPQAPRV